MQFSFAANFIWVQVLVVCRANIFLSYFSPVLLFSLCPLDTLMYCVITFTQTTTSRGTFVTITIDCYNSEPEPQE